MIVDDKIEFYFTYLYYFAPEWVSLSLLRFSTPTETRIYIWSEHFAITDQNMKMRWLFQFFLTISNWMADMNGLWITGNTVVVFPSTVPSHIVDCYLIVRTLSAWRFEGHCVCTLRRAPRYNQKAFICIQHNYSTSRSWLFISFLHRRDYSSRVRIAFQHRFCII